METKRVSYPTEDGGVIFFCPGCRCGHKVWVTSPAPSGSQWKFNNNFEAPSLQPSILFVQKTWTPPVTPENIDAFQTAPWPQTEVETRCHSFVTNGHIQFLEDSTHELRGKTVPLEPF